MVVSGSIGLQMNSSLVQGPRTKFRSTANAFCFGQALFFYDCNFYVIFRGGGGGGGGGETDISGRAA